MAMAMAVSSAPLAFGVSPKRNSAFAASTATPSSDLAVRGGARTLRRLCRCEAGSEDREASTSGGGNVSENVDARETGVRDGGEERSIPDARPRKRVESSRTADSTDWISSNLTRRFGLGAGLAWFGVLAFGVISEQIKTRTEVFQEEQGTRDVEGSKEVVLQNGIRYTDLRKGGGSTPQRGDLVVINLTGRVASTGEVFIDTTAEGKRPVAFIFGAKPYSGGMCDGVEYVLMSTRVGGKRRVTVPAALAFGESGTTLNTEFEIPGNATLEYVVEILKASIAPS